LRRQKGRNVRNFKKRPGGGGGKKSKTTKGIGKLGRKNLSQQEPSCQSIELVNVGGRKKKARHETTVVYCPPAKKGWPTGSGEGRNKEGKRRVIRLTKGSERGGSCFCTKPVHG